MENNGSDSFRVTRVTEEKHTWKCLPGTSTASVKVEEHRSEGAAKENSQVDKAQRERLIASFVEVFSNEMLLEMIIKYAIFKKGEVQRRAICPFRHVNRIWQDTVTKMLRKKGKPLFHFVLDRTCSLAENVWVDESDKKCVDKFVDICLNIDPDNSPPTFGLRIQPCFFLAGLFCLSLYYYLVHCGDGLVELELTFPDHTHDPYLSEDFPLVQVTFPRLRKLIINFTGKSIQRCVHADSISRGHVQLIQFLLNGAPTLEEFVVPLVSLAWAPPGFETIILPQSVTTLELTCRLKTDQIQKFFEVNGLQKLAKLNLRAGTYFFQGGLLFSILKRFRRTLDHLIITQGANSSYDRNVLNFPVMEALKTIHIIGELGKTAQVGVNCFPRCFPKLVELSFLHQYERDFNKFVKSSTILPTVKHLDLELWLNREMPILESLHSGRLRRVNASFPNLSSLSLSTWVDSCMLQYIFQEMSQLESLSITVPHLQPGSPKCWDAFVIGNTVSSTDWSCVAGELELKTGKPSIRLMTKLKRLSLISSISSIHTEARGPLISDEAFHHAFFKMDSLMELKLEGRFSPSALMIQQWEKMGRTFMNP